MPSRYAALFRGINVGRAKRVSMAELRTLFESLGYADVQTLLNSGNVVFTSGNKLSSSAAGRIEEALATKLGVSARVTLLSAAEVAEAVEANPLLGVATDPSRLLVSALRNAADRSKLESLLKLDWGDEALALGARVAYIWSPKGVLESRSAEAVGKALGDGVTTRNWATILKLHAMLGAKSNLGNKRSR